MWKSPKIILGAGMAVLALVGTTFYGFYQLREFLSGPLVSIDEPADGAVFALPLITLSGRARNIAFITLNGRQIFTDGEGGISESLLLQNGYNIITIEAKDRFGHLVKKRLEVVLKSEVAASR
jgi:hypothetical protein